MFVPAQLLLLLANNFMLYSTEYEYAGHETVAQITGIIIHVVSLILCCFVGNMGMKGIGLSTILGHASRLLVIFIAHFRITAWKDADKRRDRFDYELKEHACQ